MTHEELAALRDAKDWKKLWPEAQSRAAFSIEQLAGKGTADPKDRNFNDELCQVGYEAAWATLPDWNIAKGALDTHIKAQVQGAIHDHWRTEQTGGIGSAWVSREGSPAEHVSMATEAGHDEDGGDMPTYLDELTYGNTDNVPAGYGSPEQELAREDIDEVIKYYMHGLTVMERNLIRAYVMGESSSYQYAEEIGAGYKMVQRLGNRITKKMSRRTKSSYVLNKGAIDWKGLMSHFPVRRRYPHFWQDAEGMFTANPIWSEATGRVYNDWAWKPLLSDLPNQQQLKKLELAAQKRAA